MKVHTELLAKLPERTRNYIFRGQEHAEWEIESGAVTRIKIQTGIQPAQQDRFNIMLKRYLEEILFEDTRKRGIDLEEGRRLTQLEILAKLQHFGAATPLLDFTHDAMIALWMACEDKTTDGAVFFIDLDTVGDRLKRIQSNGEDEDIVEMATGENAGMLYCWEPVAKGDPAGRMIGQKSIFIIGPPAVLSELSTKIIVDKNAKGQIRDELASFFGIDSTSLFPDLPGYANRNGRKMPIPGFEQPAQHWHWGNRLLSENRPDEATGRYSEYLDRYPQDGAVWFAMGNALSASNQHSKAIDAYTKAIELEGRTEAWGPSLPLADLSNVYFNRANVKAAEEDFDGAIQDYELSVEVGDSGVTRFNWGNALGRLGRWREAAEQYDRAIEMGNTDAWWNRGNTLVHLGEIKDSINCYKTWSEKKGMELNDNMNLRRAKELCELIAGRDTTVEHTGQEAFITVDWNSQHNTTGSSDFVFNGDIGNVGNFGSAGIKVRGPTSDDAPTADIPPTPGGKGFKGYPAFRVRVQMADRS